jgi:hypothetical protein
VSKFLAGERVRLRQDPSRVGTVERQEKLDPAGMVRFKLDAVTQRGAVAQWLLVPERDVEHAPDRKFKIGDRVVWTCAPFGLLHGTVLQVHRDDGCGVQIDNGCWYGWVSEAALAPEHAVKVGQRVQIVSSPRPESKFAINMCGTTSTGETGGTFEVKLDNGARVWCDRSMVRFIDEEAQKQKGPKPLLNETFFCESWRSDDCNRCVGEELYDVSLKAMVNAGGSHRGGALNLKLRDRKLLTVGKYFKVTVTPVEEQKFKVGERVRLKWRPRPQQLADWCYLEGAGPVVVYYGNGMYGVHLDKSGVTPVHEDALETEPLVKPCPCCGNASLAQAKAIPTIYCGVCSLSATGKTFEEARSKWNRRTA